LYWGLGGGGDLEELEEESLVVVTMDSSPLSSSLKIGGCLAFRADVILDFWILGWS